jgi:hypothetical protein
MKFVAPILPAPPSQERGLTRVRGRCPLRFIDLLPPWGGPAETA